jgi:hypothetical protein
MVFSFLSDLLTSDGVYSEGLVVALLQLGEKGALLRRW